MGGTWDPRVSKRHREGQGSPSSAWTPSLPSMGLIRGANVKATACAPEDSKSIWQEAGALQPSGCESGELPPERSNLGSERSQERPGTPGTGDCTACAAVSLACSSHRVRLLTSRAVTSHRIAHRRLSLRVPRDAAAASTGGCVLRGTHETAQTPRIAPMGPPTPPTGTSSCCRDGR